MQTIIIRSAQQIQSKRIRVCVCVCYEYERSEEIRRRKKCHSLTVYYNIMCNKYYDIDENVERTYFAYVPFGFVQKYICRYVSRVTTDTTEQSDIPIFKYSRKYWSKSRTLLPDRSIRIKMSCERFSFSTKIPTSFSIVFGAHTQYRVFVADSNVSALRKPPYITRPSVQQYLTVYIILCQYVRFRINVNVFFFVNTTYNVIIFVRSGKLVILCKRRRRQKRLG